MTDNAIIGGAVFNDDRTHRFQLTRTWDVSKGNVTFIGLNPSRADSVTNDRTIKRCIEFANAWGFGGLYFCNLFSFRTPYVYGPVKNLPGENWFPLVEKLDEANNKLTDSHLAASIADSEKIICAWGSWEFATERIKQVKELLLKSKHSEFYALRVNQNGTPNHPLYMKASTIPLVYFKNEKEVVR